MRQERDHGASAPFNGQWPQEKGGSGILVKHCGGGWLSHQDPEVSLHMGGRGW